MKAWRDPLALELVLYPVLAFAGVTGAALAAFMGKLLAAALLAAFSIGCYLRFKRGRVAKAKDSQA